MQKTQKNICQTFVIISIETPPSPKQFNIIGKVGHCLEKQHLSPVYFLRQSFIDNFELNFLPNIIKLIFILFKQCSFSMFCFLQVKCVEIFKCFVYCHDNFFAFKLFFAIRHFQYEIFRNMLENDCLNHMQYNFESKEFDIIENKNVV